MSDGLSADKGFLLPDGIYLLSHSVGAQLASAQEALSQHYLSPWQHQGGDAWPQWLAGIEDFCHALAALLNGRSEDFCPQTNLSSALTKYLMALPHQSTRRCILMHASAFPSIGFVAQALAHSGWALRLIDAELPADDPAVWEAHITPDTAVAVITHVHSNTGVCSPVKDIIDVCRHKGCRTVVDVAQSAGVMPIDLAAWQADMVMGSCVKWLCGGPGAGYMWINPESLQSLSPVDVGWFSHQDPFEFDIRQFSYADSAKRFWGGTPSVAPYILAANSINEIARIGVHTILEHNRRLMQPLINGLEGHLLSTPDLQRMGGTLCASLKPDSVDGLAQTLTRAGARFDRRANVLRMSLHIYNTESDIMSLVQAIENDR